MISNTDDYTVKLNNHLEKSWKQAITPWENMGKVTDLAEGGRNYLQGGKRTRAKLAWLGYQLAKSASTCQDNAILDLGVAIELYQASALVHDDLIDRADLRRGRPCLHHQFHSLHQSRQLNGQSQHFGLSAAILLGDLLLSTAQQFANLAFQQAPLANAAQTAGIENFYQMTQEVAIGQYLDLYLESDPQATLSDIIQTITLKSARYSVAHPLVLGARLGGASEKIVRELFNIGQTWGLAFQMRDDHLGVLGNPEQTGKLAGEDIREGKRTRLWALIEQSEDQQLKKHWSQIFGQRRATASEIEKVQKLLANSTVLAQHEAQINSYFENGLLQLNQLDLPKEWKMKLIELGKRLSFRQS